MYSPTSVWSCLSFKKNPYYKFMHYACLVEQGDSGASHQDGLSQIAFSRLLRPLPQQLGSHYQRQLSASNHEGLQNRIPANPLPKPQTSSNFLHTGRGEVHAGGDPKHAKQMCHLRHREHPGRVLLPNVLSSQKGWQAETCDKPEAGKSVIEDQALQNGGHPYAQRPTKSRRLDGQNRLEGCLLHGLHGRGGQKVPLLPVERKGIPVQLPALRSVTHLGLYQDHTAGGRNANIHLCRQYPHSSRNRVFVEGPHYGCGLPSGKLGGCHQPPQITANPLPGGRIPGVHGKHHEHGAEAPRGEDKNDQTRDRQSLTVSNSDSPNAVRLIGNECSHSGHSYGSLIYQGCLQVLLSKLIK